MLSHKLRETDRLLPDDLLAVMQQLGPQVEAKLIRKEDEYFHHWKTPDNEVLDSHPGLRLKQAVGIKVFRNDAVGVVRMQYETNGNFIPAGVLKRSIISLTTQQLRPGRLLAANPDIKGAMTLEDELKIPAQWVPAFPNGDDSICRHPRYSGHQWLQEHNWYVRINQRNKVQEEDGGDHPMHLHE